jgi:hypothetical protein
VPAQAHRCPNCFCFSPVLNWVEWNPLSEDRRWAGIRFPRPAVGELTKRKNLPRKSGDALRVRTGIRCLARICFYHVTDRSRLLESILTEHHGSRILRWASSGRVKSLVRTALHLRANGSPKWCRRKPLAFGRLDSCLGHGDKTEHGLIFSPGELIVIASPQDTLSGESIV